MPRELVVGNGNLLICLDKFLHLRDLYYPRVGELNHIVGHYHRMGVWVDGHFSWLHSGEWDIQIGYASDSLVGESTAQHKSLPICLKISDGVMPDKDIYFRRVQIEATDEKSNEAPKTRDVRVFFAQDYYLYESDIGDTAFYDPHSDGVVHYKRETYFLSSGLVNGRGKPHDYSCGTKKFNGAEGTWRDAEDGEISGNPIAQGSVDSALGFRVSLTTGQPATVDYWIIAAHNLMEARKINKAIFKTGIESALNQTQSYWRNWTSSQMSSRISELPPHLEALFKRSLLTIRTQADNGGAITAANDTDYFSFSRDTYSYMWPRDGAFVAYALDQAGHQDLTRRFYEFCFRIFKQNFDPLPDSGAEPMGYFFHKYTPSGSVGSSWHPWITRKGDPILPIQEDETALVLWSLWHHYQTHRDVEFVRSMYDEMILPAANFLAFYRDPKTDLPLPSYDLWEEILGVHTFTVAAVYGGLDAAANFATLFGDTASALKYRKAAESVRDAAIKHLWCEEKQHFYRHVNIDPETGNLAGDSLLGASTYAIFAFDLLPADDPKVVANMQAIENKLWVKAKSGGVARYQNDYYHQISSDTDAIPGNPWIVCTMWLAQWKIAKATTLDDLEPAIALMEWAHQQCLPSGLMPEQMNPYTGEAISVAPLTWSHAAFVSTVSLYLQKTQKLAKRDRLRHNGNSAVSSLASNRE